MDKIGRIKRLVESSLDTSFGGDVIVRELTIFPTQKYDHTLDKWVSDSFTVFLTIEDNRPENNPSYSGLTVFDSDLSSQLESLLGYEFCIQVM